MEKSWVHDALDQGLFPHVREGDGEEEEMERRDGGKRPSSKGRSVLFGGFPELLVKRHAKRNLGEETAREKRKSWSVKAD